MKTYIPFGLGLFCIVISFGWINLMPEGEVMQPWQKYAGLALGLSFLVWTWVNSGRALRAVKEEDSGLVREEIEPTPTETEKVETEEAESEPTETTEERERREESKAWIRSEFAKKIQDKQTLKEEAKKERLKILKDKNLSTEEVGELLDELQKAEKEILKKLEVKDMLDE